MIKSLEELEEKKKKKKALIVVFTADWSPESKRLMEEVAKLASMYKIDADEVDIEIVPEVVKKERIIYVPTVKLYINGEAKFVHEGSTGTVSIDKEHIRRGIKEILKKYGILET